MLRAFCTCYQFPLFPLAGVCTHVQEDDFCNERCNNKTQQNVEEPLVKLGLSTCLCDHCCAESLSSHHTQASNQTADTQVHQHALLSVATSSPDCCHSTSNYSAA